MTKNFVPIKQDTKKVEIEYNNKTEQSYKKYNLEVQMKLIL